MNATTPAAKTVKSAHYSRYGDPRTVVEIREIPIPQPPSGHVVVRMQAASVNAADGVLATGEPMFARPMIGLRRPRRPPGSDLAGVISAVGAGVTRWSLGDEVFGELKGGGAFAEYVIVGEGELSARNGVSAEDAATLGIAAGTALQGLRDWAGLRPGERVQINGASGGVGTFAVQLAKVLEAGHITAVCSTGNVDTARSLGADVVVDYRTEPFGNVGSGFDVYFDNAGSQPLVDCRNRLASGGRYVMVTAPKSRWLHPLPRVLAGGPRFIGSGKKAMMSKIAQPDAADAEILRDHVLAGRVRPVITARWPLAETAEAVGAQVDGHARGKSLIVPSPRVGSANSATAGFAGSSPHKPDVSGIRRSPRRLQKAR